MELRLTICVLAFIGAVTAVPVTQWEQVSKCSRQCSTAPENFNYEQGKTYTYNYETTTRLNLDGESGPLVRLAAKADISVLEPCELALKLRDVTVDGQVDSADIKSVLESQSLVFGYDDGRVESVCASPDDEQWAVNVKRGIVTALQVSMRSMSGSQIMREKDVLGDCETTYEVIAQDGRSTQLRKTKSMASCGKRHQAIAALFPRSFASAPNAMQTLPIMSNDFACDVTVTRNLVTKSECTDLNAFLPLSWSQAGANIETKIKLEFLNVNSGLSARRPAVQQRTHLLFARNPETEKADASKVLALLRDICQKTENEIDASVPAKFAELVYSVRQLSDSDANQVNKQVKSGSVCSSKKIKDIWTDALVMDASSSSAKIVAELIKNKEVSKARATYMLTMLAFANRPTRSAVKALAPLIADQSSPRQALLGVSALVRNLIEEEPSAANSAEVKSVVDALIQIARREKNSDKAIVAIKALRNVAHIGQEGKQALLEIATNKNLKAQVQVNAWEALKEHAEDDQVNQKALDILADQQLNDEVRIAAYKVAVHKPTRQSIQQIITVLKRESSKQVGSYLSSHLENLQETSNPHHKQLRDLLAAENIPSHKFPKDIRKYSRNFEVSHMFEAANIGGVLDADLIYSHGSFVPRQVKVNVTAPVAGKSVNVIEAGLFQVGLEKQLEKVFGPSGSVNVPEIITEVASFFTESNPEINEIRSNNRFRRAQRPAYRGADAEQADAEAAFYLNVDGKTILYISTNDADSDDLREIAQAISQKVAKISESVKEDRAFSFMFLDSTHHVPSASGLPVKIDLNGTAILGYKFTDKGVWPSVAVEMSTKVGFDVKTANPGVKLVQRLSSAPAITAQVESKNGRPAKVTFNLPKNQIELIKFESQVFVVESNHNERKLAAPSQSRAGCTTSFNNALGVELCSKMVTPKPFFNPKTPFLPFNGPWQFEVTLKKTDAAMQGWEYTLELPSGDAAQQVFRAAFNTPGSRIDREHAAELQLTADNNVQGARLNVKTPGKQIEGAAQYKYDAQSVMYRGEVTVDQKDKYVAEMGLEKSQKDKKAEWKPKLRIELPNAKPIQLGGSVIVDHGRKQQLAFDLRSNQQSNKQFFRGQFIKEGQVGIANDFKLSSDIQGDIGLLAFRLFGTADKQAKAVATDMKIEYQRPNSRKHNAKLVGKVQNLSAGQLTKINSFVELQMTQLPAKNFHLSWNVQQKPNEHLENEVTFMWRDNMRDPNRKIHILQVSRATGLTSGRTATSENLLNVEIAPLRINYELKAAGHVEKGETPKFKIELEAKDKNDRRQAQPVKASFDYQHISRKPLKLSMDALLRTPARELVYSDKLEEVAPNEYKGKTQFQWQQDKKTTVDYTYRVKSDSRNHQSELDVQVKTPSQQHGTHHQMLLRMSPADYEVRSKLANERQQLWDFSSLFSNQGRSNVQLDTAHFNAKVNANPFERTRSGAFELTGKTFPLSHQSNFQITDDSFTAASKTIHKNRPVLTMNAERAAGRTSQLSIMTPLFEAKVQGDQQSTPKVASIEIRTKSTPGHHRTVVSADSNKVEIKSKTQYKNKPVANIDAVLAKRGKSQVTIDIPQGSAIAEAHIGATKSGKIELTTKTATHKTEITADRSGLIRVNSQTKRGAQNVASFDGQYGQKSFARFNCPHFASNAEYDHQTHETKFNVKDLQHNWQHASELARRGAEWQLTSNTDSQGQQFLNLDGSYSRARSALKINGQPAEASLEFVPYQSARFEVTGKKSPFTHKTTINAERAAWIVDSKTKSGRSVFNVEARRQQNGQAKLAITTTDANGFAEVEPKAARLVINAQRYAHKTEAAWQPQQLTIDSNTDYNSRSYAKVNAQLQRQGKNSVRVQLQDAEGQLELDVPAKVAKIALKNARAAHETEARLSDVFVIKSKTQKDRNVLANIDAVLAKRGKSQVTVEIPQGSAIAEATIGSTKSGKIEVTTKTVSHKSEFNADRSGLIRVSSHTKRGAENVASFEGQYGPKSFARFNCPRFSSNAEYDHQTYDTKIHVKDLQNNWQHASELARRGAAWQLTSNTGSRGQQLFNLDGSYSRPRSALKIDAHQLFNLDGSYSPSRSALKIDAQPAEASFEFVPSKSARVEIRGKKTPFNHETSVNTERATWVIDSKTKSGRSILNVEARHQPSGLSKLAIVTADANGLAEFEPKAARLVINTQRYAHKTDAAWQPQQFTIDSNTDVDARSFAKVNAQLQRQGKNSVRVQLQNGEGQLELDVPAKSAKITLKNARAVHETEAQLGDVVVIKSKTQKDRNVVANIDAALSRRRRSHLAIETISHKGRLEVSPYDSIKSGKFSLEGLNSGYRHSTEAKVGRGDAEIKSISERNGVVIAKVNAKLNKARSEFELESAALDARGHIEPVNYAANLEIRGKELALEHATNVALNRQATLKTSTQWNGKERFLIDAISTPEEIKANALNDLFEGKVHAEANKLSTEYRCRRQRNAPLLKSIFEFKPADKAAEFEMMWDADRNQEAKISIVASAKPATRSDRKSRANLNVRIGSKTELSAETAMASDLLTGPHDIEVTYKNARQTPKSLKMHHSVSNGEVKCEAIYYDNGVQKASVLNKGHFQANRDGIDFAASLDVKSERAYQNIDGLHASIKHNHKASRGFLESTSSVNGRLGNGKPVAAKLDAKYEQSRNNGKVTVRASAETPLYDFNSQNAELTASWSPKAVAAQLNAKSRNQEIVSDASAAFESDKLSFEANCNANGKRSQAKFEAAAKNGQAQVEGTWTSSNRQVAQAKLMAKADRNQAQLVAELNNKQKLSLKAQRDATSAQLVADVDGKQKLAVKATADQQSLSLAVDVDGQRQFQAKANGRFNSVDDFNGQAEVKTAWTPRYAVDGRYKRDAQSVNGEATATLDSRQVAAAKVNARYSRSANKIEATAMLKGQELFRLTAEQSQSAGEHQATASLRGKNIPPFQATAKLYQDNKEIRPVIELCQARQCVSAKGQYRNEDSRYYNQLDRQLRAEISLPGQQRAAEVQWTLNTKQNFVNKLSAKVNNVEVGYDLEHQSQGNKQSIKAELHLPKRTIALNAAADKPARDEYQLTAALQGDAKREPQDKLTIELNHKTRSSRSARSVQSELKASHPSLTRPLTVAFAAESGSKTQAKLLLDIARDSSKKTVLTAVIDGQSANKTAELAIKSDDGKINGKVLAHIAANQHGKSSHGVNWQWTDRRRQQKAGMYIVEVDNKNIKITSNSPLGFYHADGVYAIRGQKMTASFNANVDGQQRIVDLELDANRAPCAQVALKNERSQELGKWRGCASAEAGRALRLTSVMSAQGQPDAESSITFDQSNGKVFRAHLKWDPEAVTSMVAKLQDITGTGSRRNRRNYGLNEIADEFRHKRDLMFADFDRDVYQPFAKSVSEEADEFAYEVKPLLDSLPDMSASRAAIREYASAAADAVTPDFSNINVSADKAMRKLTHAIKRNFDRNSAPYKVAAAYDRRGPAAAAQELSRVIREVARDAHQITSEVAGNYAKVVSNAIPQEWVKQVKAAAAKGSDALINNDIAKSVGQMAAKSAAATRDQIAELLRLAAELIAQAVEHSTTNKDIKEIAKVIEEILREIQHEFKNVDTRNIDQMAQKMVSYLASPEAWSSHARTTTWNPEEGDIMVEIRSPVDVRRFGQTSSDKQRRSLADKVYRSRG